MALTPPATLSPSKVSSFKDCALAFRYSAIDRLPEPPTAAATKGTLVHLALEHLFEREPAERTPVAARADLARASAEIRVDPEFVELALDPEAEAAFFADAARLVERYFELEDPTAIRPIGLELRLEAEVGGLRLRGIIDRLELDEDGGLVVTDYKSGKAPGQTYQQGRLGGVAFYSLLCEELFGVRPSRVQLLYLGDTTTIATVPTEQSTRGLRTKVSALWKAVEQACEREDFRPRPGPLCSWCGFHAYCPAKGGDPSLVAGVVAARAAAEAAAAAARDAELAGAPVALRVVAG
ncbi:PD-(D/E)XK nuclease family protein [Aquihabitans sp. G128]|uniref:RecB family exonuclease n=1 Tax=Aquihabitans sp. G128 TaxID=2849779 RepID=UPI001C21A91E|nr:PD-(D/E)XK nuclease family protein [Aquihabitans sp. G128]QXC61482.1 PD-(D/E)XK nuclease family protein [Aquihabitans sp. G128]